MSDKQKAIHNAYCDYEVAKAKTPSRIYSVQSEATRKPQGIKTNKANYYALLLAVAKKVSAKEALIEMGISPENEKEITKDA